MNTSNVLSKHPSNQIAGGGAGELSLLLLDLLSSMKKKYYSFQTSLVNSEGLLILSKVPLKSSKAPKQIKEAQLKMLKNKYSHCTL